MNTQKIELTRSELTSLLVLCTEEIKHRHFFSADQPEASRLIWLENCSNVVVKVSNALIKF